MSLKKILASLLAAVTVVGMNAAALTLDVAEAADETVVAEEAVLADETKVDRTNYTEMLEALGYTFTLSGVHITESGYYTLEGEKVETEADADVQVTDPVNKKMKYLNGTTWQDVSKVFEVEHTEWEKEAIGVYLAGVKITETGYYNNDGSPADEGAVYVDLENKRITLNNADITLTNGEMTLLESIVDPDYTGGSYQGKSLYDNITGVPGALVITEGTYNTPGSGAGPGNWDCYYYLPIGYETDYKFGSIALGIMADDESGEEYEAWTLELVGDNKITVNSSFGMPQQIGYLLDAPAFGIFAEADLTITGSGSLKAVANNKWDILKMGYKAHFDESSAGAIWSKGNLNINGGSISASVSTTEIENANYGCTMTGNNTIGALGASGAVTISGSNTVVDATTTTTQGFAISSGTSVTITDNATVVAESKSDIAGAAIAGVAQSGWFSQSFPVTISEGAKVTANATSTIDNQELASGVGIAGSNVTITNATVDVDAQMAGVSGDAVNVSGGNVSVDVLNDDGMAVSAGTAAISSGTYNTALPDDYLAEGSAVVNGSVTSEIPENWAVKLGDTGYYTDISYAQLVIDKFDVIKYAEYNNVVWFNESASVTRSGLSLGDVITIYVKHGKTVDVDFTGDRLMAQLEIVEGAEDGAAVLAAEAVAGYDAYIYTMVVDPAKAYIKVVKANGEVGHFLEFGTNYSDNTAFEFAEDGDTLIILDDMEYVNNSGYHGGAYSIYDAVTFDLNGHTITSNDMSSTISLQSFFREATVTFVDTSESGTGAIINTNGGAAIANGYQKATVVIEGGKYSTTEGEALSNSGTMVVNGGVVIGEIKNYNGTVTVYGGTFSVDPTAYLAEGYTTAQYSDGRYGVVKAETVGNTSVSVVFEDVTAEDAEGEKVYNINLVADAEKVINRLNSADLTFVLTTDEGKIAYEIVDVANDNIVVNNVEADRYEFHFDTKTEVTNDTATAITIAQVKFSGYGKFDFAVDASVETNVAHATKALDNIVDTFIPGGTVDAEGNKVGNLVIDDNTITDIVIYVPTRELVVNVDFPNAVNNKEISYQDMQVTVSGGDLAAAIEIALGSDAVETVPEVDGKEAPKYSVEFADGAYVVTLTDVLTLNTTYNVEVTGAGYRTARYTVTMTEEKTLNFWNNVKDNAVEVEEGKTSSAVTKNFLAGDIVGDNNINIYDLSAVVSYFATKVENPDDYAKYVKYDLNRDGVIDSKDVAYVLVSWGA